MYVDNETKLVTNTDTNKETITWDDIRIVVSNKTSKLISDVLLTEIILENLSAVDLDINITIGLDIIDTLTKDIEIW